MDDRDHYIRRINTANEDLRRRNGELYTTLQEAAPELAAKYTPLPDYPQRYLRINNIIGTIGRSYARTQIDGFHPDDGVELALNLYDHYDELANYWQNIENERETKSQMTKAARLARQEA